MKQIYQQLAQFTIWLTAGADIDSFRKTQLDKKKWQQITKSCEEERYYNLQHSQTDLEGKNLLTEKYFTIADLIWAVNYVSNKQSGPFIKSHLPPTQVKMSNELI